MPFKPKDETSGSFKKGDKVLAKRTGSNAHTDATVVEVTPKGFKVSFDDGSVRSLKSSDIKAPKARSSSRSKSTRTRSRSRSAGRKPTPPRSRSRSPARRSTSKTEKKTPSKLEKDSNSLAEKKLSEVKTSYVKEVTLSTTVTDKSNDKNTVTSNRDIVFGEQDMDRNFLNMAGLRTSARIAALQIARSTIKSSETSTPSNAVSKDNNTFSDDESDEDEVQELVKENYKPGRFWVLSSIQLLIQTLFMPVVAILLHLACSKKQCTVMAFPRFPQRWTSYFDYKAGLVYFCFLVLQAILLLLPIGKEVNGLPFGEKESVLKYRLNGFYSAIISIQLLGVLAYFEVPLNFGGDKFFALMIVSIVFSTLLSIVLYVKSRNAPAHLLSESANSGFFPGFRDGRELNPRFGKKFDIKVYVCRVSLIAWALLDLCFLYKSYYVKGYISTSLALTVGMQVFYLLDFFWNEENLLSSAAFTTDGTGYEMVMGSCTMISFTYNLQAYYLVNYGTKANTLPHWCSAAIIALFFCGYFIYRRSTNMKHAFRKNPYSPAMANVESVPTSKKKRLIVSGWWGVVRHPNYLGELLMFIAWTLPSGFNHFIPLFPLLNTCFLLMLRSVVIEAQCRNKYGPAWQTYTEKVRSRMLPYVF